MRKYLAPLALWLVYVPLAHAQDLGADKLNAIGKSAYGSSAPASLPLIIGNLVKIFIGLLGIIFLLLAVYAGFLYLTAQGDKDKVQKAKDTLQRGVIGLIIISAAYALASFVINALTNVTKTGTGT